MRHDVDVNKAIGILKRRGIEAKVESQTPDRTDFFLSVLDFTLTGRQLIELMNTDKLTEKGIREFNANYEKERKS